MAKLNALLENAGDNVQQQVQSLIDEYKAIGHVPFKEKDAIYKQYHDVLDKYTRTCISATPSATSTTSRTT